jgi:hypothetical protein
MTEMGPRRSDTIRFGTRCSLVNQATDSSPHSLRRAGYFTVLLLIVNVVADGWTGRPTEFLHQLLLLPVTGLFLWCLYRLLRPRLLEGAGWWNVGRALRLVLLFEFGFLGLYLYECRHFAAFGYRARPGAAAILLGGSILLLGFALRKGASAALIVGAATFASAAGLLLSIISFPLNYLRSDMLAVIFWADRSLLLHMDPYTTLHVGGRLYDFPYLPGMMLAYYPATAFGLDVRFGSIAYLLGMAGLIFWAARGERRREVSTLIALFLLCPFLQYRHELYLSPHWFTLTLLFVLMFRRHFAWAAVVFGFSMAIYQFSWILFPFFVLNGLRRRGWGEATKMALLGVLGALVLAGPLLLTAGHRIATNTVGQWGHLLKHALADPMNLSYWATYVIHPEKLLRLQAALMVAIFLYCFVKGRCVDFVDTLRWMVVALTTFVMFNVLVDGYFFLMLLVPMLVYTCAANGWWAEPKSQERADVMA